MPCSRSTQAAMTGSRSVPWRVKALPVKLEPCSFSHAAEAIDRDMRGAKDENMACVTEISQLQTLAAALKQQRRKLQGELCTEEDERVKCQRQVIRGSYERIEKSAVIEDAREAAANLKALLESPQG